MESFGKFCYAMILLVLTTMIGGYVFLKLYEWFVVTTFHAPAITITQAIGLMLFIGYIKPKSTTKGEKFDAKKFTVWFIEMVGMAALVLGIGYLIVQFN